MERKASRLQRAIASESEQARRKPPSFRDAEAECEVGESKGCPFILPRGNPLDDYWT